MEKHQQAFNELKDNITKQPVIQPANLNQDFQLCTDASKIAISAVLQQIGADGQPHIVGCASRLLLPAETRYYTQEQEGLAVVYGLIKFRTYLLGRHFTIFTDHEALKSIMSKPTPSARLTRWALAMQEYNFKIVHVPGIQNVVPDALSRPTLICIMVPSNIEQWRTAQEHDAFCVEVIRQLVALSESGRSSETDLATFTINGNGLLVLADSDTQPRLVVPRSLVPSVLEQTHSDPMGAHQGINRTVATVGTRYFWVNWRREVADHVRSCKSCQQRKNYFPRPLPVLQITSDGPNRLLAADLLGPLNMTSNGNMFILVLMDIFTRFACTVALRNTSAETVTQAIVEQWIGVHGVPDALLTDNGGNFSSAASEDICNLFKIHKIWTSPYRPQTDGSVERFNRTLADMLSHFVNDRHDNWDKFLPLVTLAYNSTFNYNRGQTPYFLMFARPAPTVTDLMLHIPGDQLTRTGEEAKAAMKAALAAAYNKIIRKQDEHQLGIGMQLEEH